MATKTASTNGKATNRVKGKPAKQTTVKIQPLNIGKITLNLEGISPLVVHNFDEKSRQEMLENQTKQNKKTKKAPRSPETEFLGAFYVVEGEIPQPNVDEETRQVSYDPKALANFVKKGMFGVPLAGFKNSLISACRNTDLRMTALRQTIFVSCPHDPTFAIIESDHPPHMDSRICRLAGAARTPIERFRPMWETWRTTIDVEFDANMMTSSEVANLVSVAGFYVGICEGRPERSSLGWGRWKIV